MDPFVDNEMRGTRVPDHYKSYRRDIYGELGWLDNFEVKNSKNNDHRFVHKKEFFDQPGNYNATFSKNNITSSEFYRSQAPKKSMAHNKRKSCPDLGVQWVLAPEGDGKYIINDRCKKSTEGFLPAVIPFLRDHSRSPVCSWFEKDVLVNQTKR